MNFLCALEDGGAVGGNSGWDIAHLALYDDTRNKLLGVAPHYLKHHSYGEYIFDHSWAHAYERAGGFIIQNHYVPCLLPRQLAHACCQKHRRRA